jgi:hypothetical protein
LGWTAWIFKKDGQERETRMDATKFDLVRIPENVSFDDLHLDADPVSDTMEFDWAPLHAILEANADLMLSCDAEVSELIVAWYSYLRLNGYRHEIAEQFFGHFEAAREFGIDRISAGPDTAH